MKLIKDLVVSLTTYPLRINTLHFTLETLFNQSIKPEKIVLVLAYEQFPNKEKDLPQTVLTYLNKGLEIIWSEDIKSFKKLIPTLRKYPNKIIVTADDDMLYPLNWLKILYKEYRKNKNVIHAHRCHLIQFDENKNISKYQEWTYELKQEITSYLCFLTGVGGVLYPPNSLHTDIFKKEIFMKLCPLADDIWFWAMATLNGTKIHNIGSEKKAYNTLAYTPGTQEGYCLAKINTIGEFKNNNQIKNVLEKYPTISQKVLVDSNKYMTISGKYVKKNFILLFTKKVYRLCKRIIKCIVFLAVC